MAYQVIFIENFKLQFSTIFMKYHIEFMYESGEKLADQRDFQDVKCVDF